MTPGVADPLEDTHPNGKRLFASAILGGLANYWGQQFVRYGARDLDWPAFFATHDDYLRECALVESGFAITGGEPLPDRLPPGYGVSRPRLLSGITTDTRAGLESMRLAVTTALRGATRVDRRVTRISRSKIGHWQVHLSDGSCIAGRRIWLAAGVLGTARIILASLENLAGVSFGDHAPYMAYTTGLRRLLTTRTVRHFNACTLERQEQDRCTLFASIYDMSAAELNLVLASTVGRAFRLLKGCSPTPLASFAQPVQIWTDKSFARVEINATTGRFSGHLEEAADDASFQDAVTAVQALGGKVWHHSRTQPGLGFHYHDLRVRQNDATEQSVAETLRNWSEGAVTCVDASVLPRIGLRPHTLTAMAVARRIVAKETPG
jgi:hypothetical protein